MALTLNLFLKRIIRRSPMLITFATYLSTGTSKNPWICEACKSIVWKYHYHINILSYTAHTSTRLEKKNYSTSTHNNMVTSTLLQHICNKLGCDRRSTFVFLILASVREQWQNCRDSLCTCNLACVYHDAHFHQCIIDCSTTRIDDVDIALSDAVQDVY